MILRGDWMIGKSRMIRCVGLGADVKAVLSVSDGSRTFAAIVGGHVGKLHSSSCDRIPRDCFL